MQLTRIDQISGTIELVSGLHIGSGNTEMHIGGTDKPVIKNPVTGQPYIPGSNLKGKMRSLMEWRAGVVGPCDGNPLNFKVYQGLAGEQRARGRDILRLFGGAPQPNLDEALLKDIGPTRLAFWDCNLDPDWVEEMKTRNLLLTETKMENSIDRIKGAAGNPRNTERVPAGARFDFRLTLRVHDGDEDLIKPLLSGLRLLELSGIGGSGSRGYGKLSFTGLRLGDQALQDELANATL